MAAWIAGTLAVSGAQGSHWPLMEEIWFYSSSWQLLLKGPPWLVFLCGSAQQALKGQPWLGSFCVAEPSRRSKDYALWSLSPLVSCVLTTVRRVWKERRQ